MLGIHHPEPGTASAEKLALLASSSLPTAPAAPTGAQATGLAVLAPPQSEPGLARRG